MENLYLKTVTQKKYTFKNTGVKNRNFQPSELRAQRNEDIKIILIKIVISPLHILVIDANRLLEN